MLSRIRSVIDPSKIDVIISNHAEPDHSGSIPALLEIAKNAKVYAAAGAGQKDLAAYYGDRGLHRRKSRRDALFGQADPHLCPPHPWSTGRTTWSPS